MPGIATFGKHIFLLLTDLVEQVFCRNATAIQSRLLSITLIVGKIIDPR